MKLMHIIGIRASFLPVIVIQKYILDIHIMVT